MITKLTEPVTRELSLTIKGRAAVITLHPRENGTPERLEFRPKGLHKGKSIPLDTLAGFLYPPSADAKPTELRALIDAAEKALRESGHIQGWYKYKRDAIDLSASPSISKTGKSNIVATTSGNVSVPGKPDLKLGLNLYQPRG